MKKLLLLFLIANIKMASAQMTLEHHYDGSASLVRVSQSEWDYMNVQGNNVNIYSLSHSLITTITLPVPNGATLSSAWSLTKGLFTTDNKYIIGYYYQILSPFMFHASIINEDGVSLFEKDSTTSGSFYNTPQGTKLVFLNTFVPGTYVYSLPGTYYSTIAAVANKKKQSKGLFNAYPNPSSEYVTLPYSLQPGEKAKMVITNALGQVIQQYKIDNTFNNILFDTGKIPSGSYFYYIEESGSKTEAKSFIKS